MINNVYQLIAPRTVGVKFEDMPTEGRVLVRPRRMAICHADQRYFQGKRNPQVLRKKLPMALIHECVGEVVADPTDTFAVGEEVVLIPNVVGEQREGIFENYAQGSGFLSSGRDGFMRELISLPPDRVVSCKGVDSSIAAIAEFVSVAVHASGRFDATAHPYRDKIAIIGDGSMAYVVACVLAARFPESKLVVVGHSREKLSLFSFVSERYLSDEVSEGLSFDHAFECAGGEGSAAAIDTVISHCRPQATLMLLGVSERPVPVYTRNVLEKGMTLVGCSRSGCEDFEGAVDIMRRGEVGQRLRQIVFADEPVRSVADIKRVFATDLQTPFKTVFEWQL